MTEPLTFKHTRPGNSRLVITRKHGEAVHIGDSLVTVRIIRGEARLSIEAPREMHIVRSELLNDG